jgi:hypothetical protein
MVRRGILQPLNIVQCCDGIWARFAMVLLEKKEENPPTLPPPPMSAICVLDAASSLIPANLSLNRILGSATNIASAEKLGVEVLVTSTWVPISFLVKRSPSNSRVSKQSTPNSNMRRASTNHWLEGSASPSFAGSVLNATIMPWCSIYLVPAWRISSISATASFL